MVRRPVSGRSADVHRLAEPRGPAVHVDEGHEAEHDAPGGGDQQRHKRPHARPTSAGRHQSEQAGHAKCGQRRPGQRGEQHPDHGDDRHAEEDSAPTSGPAAATRRPDPDSPNGCGRGRPGTDHGSGGHQEPRREVVAVDEGAKRVGARARRLQQAQHELGVSARRATAATAASPPTRASALQNWRVPPAKRGASAEERQTPSTTVARASSVCRGTIDSFESGEGAATRAVRSSESCSSPRG